MIDINLIRNRPEYVKAQVARKGYLFLVDDFLMFDRWMRDAGEIVGYLKMGRKNLTEEMVECPSQRESYLALLRELKELITHAEKDYAQLGKIVKGVMSEIPNLPHESVPGGPIAFHTTIPEKGFFSHI